MSGPIPPLKLAPFFRPPRHEDSLDKTAMMGDASQMFSRRYSQQSTGSDATSPDTPTFSTTCHTRNTSVSSLSSSPPTDYDSPTFQKPTLPQLPEVAEEPTERDGSFECRLAHSFDSARSWEQEQNLSNVRESLMLALPNPFGGRNPFASDREPFPEPQLKRRKSGEFTFNSFTSRMATHLPSLSRRARERKRTISRGASSEPCSEVTSPVFGRSRSTSRRRTFFGRSGSSEIECDIPDVPQLPVRIECSNMGRDTTDVPQLPTRIATIAEDDEEGKSVHALMDSHVDGLGIYAQHDQQDQNADDALSPASVNISAAAEPLDSPSQSPTVAAWSNGHASMASTVVNSPPNVSAISPPLSSKPSLSHLHQPQSPVSPIADIPPLLIEEEDEWSNRLGHANYHINPAPYLPEHCDVKAVDQLFKDWEAARAEFTRHLGRCNTHFGSTSKTYRLTEEKWAEIDAQWKQNYDRALKWAVDSGQPLPPDTPFEPAPIFKMPEVASIKFPKLGDEDIVGPMSQDAPAIVRRPSKKSQLMNMIGGFQRRNRSSSGPRP